MDGGIGVDGGPIGKYDCGGGAGVIGKNCNGGDVGGPYLGPFGDGDGDNGGGTPYCGR